MADKKIGKILIVDDDEDILLAAKMLLKRHVSSVIIEKDPRKIPFLLNQDSYDVILLDMNFSEDTTSGREGVFWLKEIMQRDPAAVVIMINYQKNCPTPPPKSQSFGLRNPRTFYAGRKNGRKPSKSK